MKKGKINIVFIVITVIICLCCDSLSIVRYNSERQKLYILETPMDIANEYMQSKYGRHWKRLNGVFSARKDNRIGRYVVARRVRNVGRIYFSKQLDMDSTSVHCETEIEGTWIEISSWHPSLYKKVGVYVRVYNEDKGYWEGRDFIMEYEDGEYIPYERIGVEHFPNKSGLEEITGMTIEEILEIAEKQQEECENMLYEMKEAELKRNQIVFLLGLILVNGTGIWLIIWKGLKRQKKDGHITETETVPENGKKI